jgi:hypothetical protein
MKPVKDVLSCSFEDLINEWIELRDAPQIQRETNEKQIVLLQQNIRQLSELMETNQRSKK